MKVLVCGSRTWTDREAILDALIGLDKIHRPAGCRCYEDQGAGYTYQDEFGPCANDAHTEITLIHGAARGADSLAAEVAECLGLDIWDFPANWEKHGRAAGFIRNQQMLDEGKPDLVLAFWDGKSRGTADMIERAKRAGVTVRVIRSDDAG